MVTVRRDSSRTSGMDVNWSGAPGWEGSAHPDYRNFAFTDLPWTKFTDPRLEGGSSPIKCVKISRSRQVLRIEFSSDFGANANEPVFAKRYLINSLRRRVGNLLSGGKARREYVLGHRLIRLGFLTPVPLAWAIAAPQRIFENPDRPTGYAQAASFLLTRDLEHAGDLLHWARNGMADQTPYFYPSLAAFLARVHKTGFYHDDCSGRNIFVAPGTLFESVPPSSRILKSFAVLDIDHGRVYPRPIPTHHRAVNLFQILRSLRKTGLKSNALRMQFLREYLRFADLDPQTAMPKLGRMIDRVAHRKMGMKLLGK